MSADSILTSIKKMLNVAEENHAFDMDITIQINSAFSTLQQIGATPKGGFWITGEETKWSDYLEGRTHLEMVKTYIYDKSKLGFDFPASSYAVAAIEKRIAETEWRLSIEELSFNPDAYNVNVPQPAVWQVDEREPLPEDMAVGDFAIDGVTGNIWRKS